jgi:hypothetical protein
MINEKPICVSIDSIFLASLQMPGVYLFRENMKQRIIKSLEFQRMDLIFLNYKLKVNNKATLWLRLVFYS